TQPCVRRHPGRRPATRHHHVALLLGHLSETTMLLKSPQRDSRELAFAEWRARIPFWNVEADRFRSAALEARRTSIVPAGLTEDIEQVQEQIRAALRECDALLEAALA